MPEISSEHPPGTVRAERGATGTDPAFERHRAARRAHWDRLAEVPPSAPARAYRRRLIEIVRFAVAPGARVLELGSGGGDLLAALRPALGVGVDLSPAMVERARRRHPGLTFLPGDAHELEALDLGAHYPPPPAAARRRGVFDAVLLVDLVNDLFDVQRVLESVRPLCGPGTRLLMTYHSRLWSGPLRLARRLGLARPALEQNWLTTADLVNLLRLARMRPLSHREEVLFPVPVPLVQPLLDRRLVRLWPVRYLALTNLLVARLAPESALRRPRVSVVVPARNEAGNVRSIFDRTPELGAGTELIFVEGHSRDDTYAAIEREIAARPQRPAVLLRQPGRGKGDAVRAGFAVATGDLLLILDADLTVPPEDLPRFVAALEQGTAELANGVRLVYPMESRAMRPANLLGNKFFSWAFTWLLGQAVRDTLCGTKGMWRDDYQRLAANRSYFGDFDPFGDFDLLFGAAKLQLDIVDLPIRYRDRTYGATNIQRWRHGLLLLRMCLFAAGRIKFV
jgi:SAM-dependent methyltransferase